MNRTKQKKNNYTYEYNSFEHSFNDGFHAAGDNFRPVVKGIDFDALGQNCRIINFINFRFYAFNNNPAVLAFKHHHHAADRLGFTILKD
ncbi:MAG: hypothetical protein BWY69_01450 [Planctomycetes bacterium ADurb.Bin401]|nr:MAG: hypothetical protein BWY69_01450 [Planctomycetes bacterium ADurb.Bin401]